MTLSIILNLLLRENSLLSRRKQQSCIESVMQGILTHPFHSPSLNSISLSSFPHICKVQEVGTTAKEHKKL
jgi:hypothetical protein